MSRIGVVIPNASLEALVDADLDTLATALYVTCDDCCATIPSVPRYRPAVRVRSRRSATPSCSPWR